MLLIKIILKINRIVDYSFRSSDLLPLPQKSNTRLACRELFDDSVCFSRRDKNFLSCSDISYLKISCKSSRFDNQVDCFELRSIASFKIIVWYKGRKLFFKLVGSQSSWWGGSSVTINTNKAVAKCLVALYSSYLSKKGLLDILNNSFKYLKMRKFVGEIIDDALTEVDSTTDSPQYLKATRNHRLALTNLQSNQFKSSNSFCHSFSMDPNKNTNTNQLDNRPFKFTEYFNIFKRNSVISYRSSTTVLGNTRAKLNM